MIKFEVGQTYKTFSVCNHDCVLTYEVIKRTTCTVTLKDNHGETKTCRISKRFSVDHEVVMPLGNYSMAPLLRAENIA